MQPKSEQMQQPGGTMPTSEETPQGVIPFSYHFHRQVPFTWAER